MSSSGSLKFSVIVPYYMAAATIQRTLESILAQTYHNYEVLLVDDASRDGLKSIVAGFSPRFVQLGASLQLITNPINSGPSVARNLGWAHATGDYVAFLDSDDEWHPQKLQFCEACLSRRLVPGVLHESCLAPDALAAVRFLCEQWQLADFTWSAVPRYKWLFRNRAATPAILVSRVVAERFDPSFRYCEDHELWLRITFRHGPFMALMGPPLTQLGRPTMTIGGQSGRIHQMRWGEMRMYFKFCCTRSYLLPVLPMLVGWSAAKHIYFLARRAFSPSTGLGFVRKAAKMADAEDSGPTNRGAI